MNTHSYAVPLWDVILDTLGVLNVKTFEFWGLTLNAITVVVAFGVLILVFIAVKNSRGVAVKVGSLVCAVLVMAGMLAANDAQLSHPKLLTAMGQQALESKDAALKVLFAKVRPPYSIELLVEHKDTSRFMKLPWTNESEKNLLEEKEKEAGNGGRNGSEKRGQVFVHFMYADDGRVVPEFFFVPHQGYPPKSQTPPVRPFQFNPAGGR